tara:strand:- start:1473 stop:2429 length:957 start_codon:yes stop_codon:yes gene_type:complete
VSIFFLVKSSDYLVSSASKIAKHFGIKQVIIGLTLVAFGTSVPELASSIAAIFSNNPEIIIGNIIGSNIANIGLVLGIGSLLSVIVLRDKIIKRDLYFLVGVSILFYIFSFNNILSRVEAIILLLTLTFYLYNLLKESKEKISEEAGKYVSAEVYQRLNHESKRIKDLFTHVLKKEFYYLLVSITVLAISAHFVIIFIKNIAVDTGIDSGIIATTLLAIGTSLPEVMVTISSIRKGLNDLLIGNIIGSNISNLLIVATIPALITPLKISAKFVTFTIPVMVVFTLLFLIVFKLLNRIRYAGVSFLLLYILFIILLFIY